MATDTYSSDRAQHSTPFIAAYTALMEHSPLPLALIERSTFVLRDANAAFCHLLGTTRALLIGHPFVAVLPVGHEIPVQGLLNQAARSGDGAAALDVQAQNGAAAGHALWAYTIWPLSDDTHDLAGFAVLVTDVTAQRRDEQTVADARAINEKLLLAGLREQALVEELQHQLAFTTAITGSLSEGVYALNCVGRITYVNRAAERILAWPAGALIGSASDVTMHLRSIRGAPTMAEGSPLHTVLRGGTAYWNEDAVWARHDGTTFPAAYSLAPIVTNEQIVGVVVVFRDMTAVRRLQQAQDEYLALISHDLRNPLTVILGRAELLHQALVRKGLEREAASAQIVINNSDRMNTMIEDLLERSRLEAGVAELRLAPLDLAQLCARIVEQDMPPDKRARIALDAEAPLVVNGDAAGIERVVVNLLTNALKFSTPASTVAVRVYRAGAHTMVSVADEGVGIDPQDIPHLFEKHYRARTAGKVAGTGLGLYISQLLIEAHGGRLWAESTRGVGSTFRFSLPVALP